MMAIFRYLSTGGTLNNVYVGRTGKDKRLRLLQKRKHDSEKMEEGSKDYSLVGVYAGGNSVAG